MTWGFKIHNDILKKQNFIINLVSMKWKKMNENPTFLSYLFHSPVTAECYTFFIWPLWMSFSLLSSSAQSQSQIKNGKLFFSIFIEEAKVDKEAMPKGDKH